MSVYFNHCALVNDDVLGFGTVKWHGISVEVFGNTKTYLGENTQTTIEGDIYSMFELNDILAVKYIHG